MHILNLHGYGGSPRNAAYGCIICAEDEMLGDHQFTRDLLENERFRSIPSGHHSSATLPLKAYFAEVLPNAEE